MSKPKLSICMMIKNEEDNLRRCLDSLQGLMNEITAELIIVDTGSTDNSVAIAQEYTDKVYFHEWDNDFSAMRNITIGYAQGDWVLIIDADEELIDYQPIAAFIKVKPNKKIGGAVMSCINILGDEGKSAPLPTARIFRREAGFHYVGVVHNQPEVKGTLIGIPATLYHYGYFLSDLALMEKKFQRTSTILKKELEKDPDNVYYRYQLAVSYSMHKEHVRALNEGLKAYETHLRLYGPVERTKVYLLGVIVQFYAACEQYSDDVIELAEECLRLEPTYIDIYFYLAQVYARREEFEKSYEWYEKYLGLLEKYDTLDIRYDITICLYTLEKASEAYYNMAVMSIRLGQFGRAKKPTKVLLEKYATSKETKFNIYKLVLELDFSTGDFKSNADFYRQIFNEDAVITAQTLGNAEAYWINAKTEIRNAYCKVMAERTDLYGILNQVRLGKMPAANLAKQALESVDLNQLPEYYSPILFGFMAEQSLCEKASDMVEERTLLEYMKHLDSTMRNEFILKSKEYINTVSFADNNEYAKARLVKNIGKFLLFSGELSDKEYANVFKHYCQAGIIFMRNIYSERVFDEVMYRDVKNVEEAFFLFFAKSQTVANIKSKYEYLEKARTIYPDMSEGVRILLNELVQKVEEKSPMESLLQQLLTQLEVLVEQREFSTALQLIKESEQIIDKDIRLLKMKTEIYRKQMELSN